MSILKMFDLSGKVAIVTGGHSGIGKGIAEGLAEAGANLVICARRFEVCREVCSGIEGKFGVKCLPIKCDVTKTDEVDNVVETTVKEFGKVDILVNSAGVGGSEKPVVKMSDEDWDMTVDIDLKGIFLCCRAAAREMIKRNEGKIINVASAMGFIASRYMSNYCASKAGVIHFTKVLALELIRYNIQVNTLCPGYFLTPLNYEFFSTEAGKKLIQNDIPMQRLGDVEELKGIAIYLASPASSFTTGAAFLVDGGHTVW